MAGYLLRSRPRAANDNKPPSPRASRATLIGSGTALIGIPESQLVFADGFLVAVLTHLSDEHGDEAGMGFLEIGFGPVEDPRYPKFADLDQAADKPIRTNNFLR